MTRTRFRFGDDQYPYFMTNTIVAWLPIFADPDCVDIVLGSWRFLQKQRGITVLGWVVLENHLHWMAVGPDLSKRVGEFKSYTALQIVELLRKKRRLTLLQELGFFKLRHKTDQDHQVWQEGSHPQIIESVEVGLQKLEYIHNNPLRRGYVDDPVHWRYSSARAYAKHPSLLEVDTAWAY